MSYSQNVDDFLRVCSQFKLGQLDTEASHPLTKDLSEACQSDPKKAVRLIKAVDENVLSILSSKVDSLRPLHARIKETLEAGHKIYLCGCGATGRLSLTIEFIWRSSVPKNLHDRVVSFMAGGDCALISSIEKFEDFPEFGERQLLELGFKEGDLLIGITEGGETPFVIGATEAATHHSTLEAFFVYCNPDDVLMKAAERSKHVIENKRIHKINLSVGPMALSGSTRMQASTVQMLSVGSCLLNFDREFKAVKDEIEHFTEMFGNQSIDELSKFVEKESGIYQRGEFITYETDQRFAMSILTDTTERSPTFSLSPFENDLDLTVIDNQNAVKDYSLCYLYLKGSKKSEDAWNALLLRSPRTFHWPNITDKTKAERLYGFDISENAKAKRNAYLKNQSHLFAISEDQKSHEIIFHLDGTKAIFSVKDLSLLCRHIYLKLLLNNMSTNIMGRLSRFEGNIMTWVKPSNNKLIDRSIRYVDMITQKEGKSYSYSEIARALFTELPTINSRNSIVAKTTAHLLKTQQS